MVSPRFAWIAVFALLMIGASACSDDDDNSTDPRFNNPITAHKTDSLYMGVIASQYTSVVNFPITFTGDSLVIRTKVTGFTGGNSNFSILDSDENLMFTVDLKNDEESEDYFRAPSIPVKAKLTFTQYSGDIEVFMETVE